MVQSMNYDEVIEQLALIEDLEQWKVHVCDIPHKAKKWIYEQAERKWIKRKLEDGSLLVHPNIRKQLIERGFKHLSVHRKMIWASFLVSYDGDDSKERFRRIKNKIIKKHNNKWWFDVYNRVKPTYAARQRLIKQANRSGVAVKFSGTKSSFLGNILLKEREETLSMIPEK